MNKLEWKEKSRDYKLGYIIGCIIMFFVGLISCLLSYLYPICVIPLISTIIIFKIIINNRIRKRKNNEKNI